MGTSLSVSRLAIAQGRSRPLMTTFSHHPPSAETGSLVFPAEALPSHEPLSLSWATASWTERHSSRVGGICNSLEAYSWTASGHGHRREKKQVRCSQLPEVYCTGLFRTAPLGAHRSKKTTRFDTVGVFVEDCRAHLFHRRPVSGLASGRQSANQATSTCL